MILGSKTTEEKFSTEIGPNKNKTLGIVLLITQIRVGEGGFFLVKFFRELATP